MGKFTDEGYEYYQLITEDGLVDVKESPKIEELKIDNSERKRKIYTFIGAVYRFQNLIIPKYKGSTLAVSRAQAINNIKYNLKIKLNLTASSSGIILKGDIIEEGG